MNKLISLAEAGQSSPVIYYGGVTSDVVRAPINGSAQEVDLGTPVNAYVQLYQYDSATGENDQFLVPALAFPMINQTGVVVVPIVQDFLQNNAPMRILNTQVIPPVPAATPGAAASSPASNQ
jgi:hypothetical protein